MTDVNFGFTREQLAIQQEINAFLDDHVTRELRLEVAAAGSEFSGTFHRAMGAAGLIGLQWPRSFGGRGMGFTEGAILQHAGALYGAPMVASITNAIVGVGIARYGSLQLQERLLPGLITGDLVFCLGFTEPEAGSDLASLTTSAVRSGRGWSVSGQKVFTSSAHVADYMLCAVRTDAHGEKHSGISLIVLEMREIDIEPIWTLGGFRTNVSHLDSVEAPSDAMLGEPGQGWEILRNLLDVERTGTARVGEARRLLTLAERHLGTNPDNAATDRLSRLWGALRATEAMCFKVAWLQDQGAPDRGEASIAKVAGTELVQDVAQACVDLLGSDALIRPPGRGSLADGEFESEVRNTVRFTVTAGTNEIQRNIIAKRALRSNSA